LSAGKLSLMSLKESRGIPLTMRAVAPISVVLRCLLAAGLCGLGACAGEGYGSPLGETLQLTTRTVDPKPWVMATRNGETGFIPVGVTPPDRPSVAMSKGQLAAATTSLDAIREREIALAAAPVPGVPRSQAVFLAEQRRRITGKGVARAPNANDTEALLKAAAESRAFANRALPKTPEAVPAVQPTSWPVPERMRGKAKGLTQCEADPTAKGCEKPGA
jgi:hypothetical protein